MEDVSPVPASQRLAYAGWRCHLVWQTALGCVYRLESPAGQVRYLKLAPGADGSVRLLAEAERTHWAGAHLPVPRVIDIGEESGVSWLVTSGLAGRSGIDDALLAQPDYLVPIIARGLRRFHDAARVDACPFDFRLDTALAVVRRRAELDLINVATDLEPAHPGLSIDAALEYLAARRPASEDLVVCHGDYCYPNVLLQDDAVVGYLDLGGLGVADRWRDLAVATWSTTRNLGPGYEGLFLEAYGVEPQPRLIEYYRLLSDLAS